MTLFLRWVLFNSLALCGLGLLGSRVAGSIHGAPLVVSIVILAATVCASGWAGRLFWKLDRLYEHGTKYRFALDRPLSHGARHLEAVTYGCQVLAALGAILGVYLTASSGGDSAATVAHNVTSAMANGLLATFTGIVCSLFLFVQHHVLVHRLEKP